MIFFVKENLLVRMEDDSATERPRNKEEEVFHDILWGEKVVHEASITSYVLYGTYYEQKTLSL